MDIKILNFNEKFEMARRKSVDMFSLSEVECLFPVLQNLWGRSAKYAGTQDAEAFLSFGSKIFVKNSESCVRFKKTEFCQKFEVFDEKKSQMPKIGA